MCVLVSEEIKTDITLVKLTPGHIVVGVGGHLHIYCKSSKKLLRKVVVFNGQKIYGISFTSSHNNFLLYGSNKVKIYQCDWNSLNFKEVSVVETNDWILSVAWLNNNTNIVTVNMHNVLTLWSASMEKIKTVVCDERCISYSSCLCHNNWDELIVMSGTVFSDVLIWWPFRTKNALCPVMCRLKGHKGVIFSISYKADLGLICSTSDDRSAKLWFVESKDLVTELKKPLINIRLLCTVFGHSSRIFRCQITRNNFLTAGEDSLVNVWTFEGKLVRNINTHQGDSVWALDTDEQDNLLVTGSGNSEVVLYKLNKKTDFVNIALGESIPRKVIIVKSGNFVVISEDGIIFYYILNKNKWILIQEHDDLKNYSLLERSLCRNLIALAGYNGGIHIYKDGGNRLKHIHSFQTNTGGRIYSLHWLTCSLFLTCESDGLLTIWAIYGNSHKLISTLTLPYSKERWSTAASLTRDKRLIVGDRKGNIHYFSLDSENPIQLIKKAHNYLGVTSLCVEENLLFSLGRDGILKSYNIHPSQLKLVSSDKLPFSWLANKDANILLVFSGKTFILWDHKGRRILLEKDCGGGHRSWDFRKCAADVLFVYIKNKLLKILKCDWDTINPVPVVEGFHSKEVNVVELICFSRQFREMFLVSGGEDTTLRLSKYENGALSSISVLKAHLSSVRTIISCEISDHVAGDVRTVSYLLFSAGGRAQIVVWELQYFIKNNGIVSVKCNEKYAYYELLTKEDSEMRIMYLVVEKTENTVILFAACSDGKIKVFTVSLKDDFDFKLKIHAVLRYKLKCILKICILTIFKCKILVSMATDGKLVFWNISDLIECILNNKTCDNNLTPFYTIQAHQSGINSYSIKIINTNACVFLTGGDDAELILHYFQFLQFNNKIEVILLDKYSSAGVHCAQITGAFVTENYFFTASIDQRVLVFKWKIKNDKLDAVILNKYDSAVADIQGMCVSEIGSQFCIIVYGKGIEILKMLK